MQINANKVKGAAAERILAILQGGTETTVELFKVFTSGYRESYRRLRSSDSFRFKTDWAAEYRENQKFYTLLNTLKNQGLVEKRKRSSGTGSLWIITENGKEKLVSLRQKLSVHPKKYNVQLDNKLKIVIFDIPEKQRRKRVMLRAILQALDFKLLQLSVWIGKNKIPEELIRDLKNENIIQYVHIFEISKEGSLARLS